MVHAQQRQRRRMRISTSAQQRDARLASRIVAGGVVTLQRQHKYRAALHITTSCERGAAHLNNTLSSRICGNTLATYYIAYQWAANALA